ncbi:MAG: patatin-like phospholipase family protein [Proteobacteria bacterium]|nr:patatin-like phospholipase family protein [Pseudomonadota bacterium]
MIYPFRNLVFEGGGVKGIAYVGAIDALDKAGILGNIERVGGTSAGAINALLLAAGFSLAETKKVLWKLDFNDFKDDSWLVLKDLQRLKDEYGWYKGNFFRSWIGEQLESQGHSGNITFQALQAATGKALFVYATNLSTHYGEVYSPEHTPRMRVVDAVRRSMSIPLFFRAITDDRGDVFVDGGVLNNYPVKLFDRLKYLQNKALIRTPGYYKDENSKLKLRKNNVRNYIYNKETLGFRLDSVKEIAVFRDGDSPQPKDISNLLEYTTSLVNTLMGVQDNQHLHSDDWHRTIYIDSLGVSTTDFDIDQKQKNALVRSGRKSTQDYLKWWGDTGSDLAINHPDATE